MSIRGEAALPRQGSCISRRVKHAHDDDFLRSKKIVNRVIAQKRRSQARRKHFAGNSRVRELAQVRQGRPNPCDQPSRGGFRALDGDIGPDLREVGVGRVR
jgi:hypothetical protein